MRKFLTKIALLFIVLAVCDFMFGCAMDYIVNHIEKGGQAKDNYICNHSEDDILIFGSSRAAHHYNAQMIEDSLGMTCYNCGEDGNGIILSYGRLRMIKERKNPKIVIQDVVAFYDLLKNDNHQYLGWLKPRYEKEGIPEIFDAVDGNEKYKMMSKMYRYNSKFLQNIFVYFFSTSPSVGIKGFRPLDGDLDTMKINKKKYNEEVIANDVDSLKLGFVNKFIELTKGTRLYFVVSPMWYGGDTLQYVSLKSICKKRHIPFIDFSVNPKYIHNNAFYKDGKHLNACGADEFTRDLIGVLKQRESQ